MQSISSRRLFVRVVATIFVTEIVVMLLLPVLFPHVGGVAEALLDGTLLSVLCAPFLWLLIVQPLRGEARDETARASAVIAASPDAILLLDAAQTICSLNPAVERLFHCPGLQLVGRPLTLLVPDGATPDGATPVGAEQEVVARRANGTTFSATLSISLLESGRRRTLFVAVLRDITERKKAEDQIRWQATHDALTGLPNRLLFEERLQQALAHARREGGQVAVLFCDLDRFKQINDLWGHGAGDTLLQEVAARLRSAVRESDTVARLGGDEFTILLPGANRATAETTAARGIEHFRRPFRLEGGEVAVTASVGIALATEHGSQAGRLLRLADAALYRAKMAGKGAYATLDPTADGRAEVDGRTPCPPTAPSPEGGDEAWRWNVTKVLVLPHKRADPIWDEFSRHWRDLHRPIAMRIPGLREYTENHGPERARLPYGVAELYFDSPEAFHAALATPEGQAALADLGNFVGRERTRMTVVSEVVTWQDPSAA